jgi:SAM-dependent methyltransferase
MNEKLTEDFYRTRHEEYFDGTCGIDPSSFLEPFLEYLPKGSTVLDVGCGSGRDMKWFKKRGFDVFGFERSPELSGLAHRHSGCEVIQGDFEKYDFGVFDVRAILLVGSLVHVPHEKVPFTLGKIGKAIRRSPGYMFLSLKKGSGSFLDKHGRIFYLWDEARIRSALDDDSIKIFNCRVNRSDFNPEDQWISLIMEKRDYD